MPRRQGSKTTILDAAEQLFARQGFKATTIQHIARESKANSALIYYYFGDKEGLYRSVLDRFADDLIGQATAALDAADSPETAVGAIVRTQAAVLNAHPERARLIFREFVDHDARHAVPLITQLAARVFSRLCATIEQGQRTGKMRRDIDARFAAISTIAQVVYFNLARPAVVILLRKKVIEPSIARAFAAHAEQFALSALQNRGGQHRAAKRPRRNKA
jgi:AcrR family transcriptional regulator